MPSDIEFTNRTLVALMAAIIHAANEERGCSPSDAVEAAMEILSKVEGGNDE